MDFKNYSITFLILLISIIEINADILNDDCRMLCFMIPEFDEGVHDPSCTPVGCTCSSADKNTIGKCVPLQPDFITNSRRCTWLCKTKMGKKFGVFNPSTNLCHCYELLECTMRAIKYRSIAVQTNAEIESSCSELGLQQNESIGFNHLMPAGSCWPVKLNNCTIKIVAHITFKGSYSNVKISVVPFIRNSNGVHQDCVTFCGGCGGSTFDPGCGGCRCNHATKRNTFRCNAVYQ